MPRLPTPIPSAAEQKVVDFFEKDYFKFVDVTRKITEKARDLIWKTTGLTPKDAVYLASAIEFAASEKLDCIHSYDTDFLALNGKLSIPVREPIPAQPLLLKVPPHKKPKKKQSGSN